MDKEIQNEIERCRQGDRSAQLKLYRRYARLLYASCHRIIARCTQ